MFSFVFRGFIFLFITVWYTVSVWNTIDSYFSTEFRRYLQHVFENNRYTEPRYIDKRKSELRFISSFPCKRHVENTKEYILMMFLHKSYATYNVKEVK